jgi:hypothetical protein
MLVALDLEIAAIRKKGSGTHVEVRGGERFTRVENSWLYRFIVDEPLNLRDEPPFESP